MIFVWYIFTLYHFTKFFCSCIVFLSFMSIFMNIFSILYRINNTSTSLGSVSEILSYFLFRTHILISSFFLIPCVGFCVLDKTTVSAKLARMTAQAQISQIYATRDFNVSLRSVYDSYLYVWDPHRMSK